MRCTVHMREPHLLREARPGELFVPHVAELQECVCVRLHYDGQSGPAGEQDTEVVVIACRVGEGEIGYQAVGHGAIVALDGWVTFVEPVERAAFRERLPSTARSANQLLDEAARSFREFCPTRL